jgi:aldehyde dehydrogenase (NAD+)
LGKFINGSQTCIAPDYLMVHESVKAELIENIRIEIEKAYGLNPEESPNFCRIVNDNAFDRLTDLMQHGTIVIGGTTNKIDRYIAPTVIDNVQANYPIMQEEIFGPLLPLLTFNELDTALSYIAECDKPLAFYYFSNNIKKAKQVIGRTTSGGGCINDTVIHIANSRLPFGGVGNSGMGKYHGKLSFDTFSNARSIVFSSTRIDIPIKYPPYKNKLGLVKYLMRL